MRDREHVGQFDSRSDEGIFLGYCIDSRAFRVYNNRTCSVMESINVVVDESLSNEADFISNDVYETLSDQDTGDVIEENSSDEDTDISKEEKNKDDEQDSWQHKGKHLLVVQIYVDDIIFGSTSPALVNEFSDFLQSEFEMSMMGELTFFLGLQVRQFEHGIFVSQTKYASNLVKKFGLDSAKHSRTPMSTTTRLSKDLDGISIDQTLYRSVIGSLLYLTASRPDIAFSVGVCARYQANPKESHLTAVKRVIKYINGTMGYGIWLSKDTNSNLAGFSDADWAGCADDRKSTSGECFYFGNNLVAWLSKKQNSISLSTTDTEYIAAGSACTQLLWMKQMLDDYGLPQECITLYCDNTSAINISKNPVRATLSHKAH
ncbi:hypothetical protein RHSIM_Rhsim11G0030000 [Rhododendron simsii]|uniref:Reverse transcriptase Ty1/copia-type domain-containing protein n=1 Tax=Rhododendron simsii TaxID=118357 RepID=A0A834LBM4_RHOSS|nr:hypothetical protein RHSIM_Rhsim11G0030000 [Rhododendron simsii]